MEALDTAAVETLENIPGFVELETSSGSIPQQFLQKDWTQKVLDELLPNEKVKTARKDFPYAPKAVGLRRVFEKFIGQIISTDVRIIQVPEATNGQRCTAVYEIVYAPYHDNSQLFKITDAADCYPGNTAAPYCKYPVATATTIAEGRALRKGLRVNVLTIEELSSAPEEQQAESDGELRMANLASPNQQHAINLACNKLGINIDKLLPTLNIQSAIAMITSDEAQTILRELNAYQRGLKNGGKDVLDAIR